MASKRLSLMLDEEEKSAKVTPYKLDLELSELENLEPRSAKRYKPNGNIATESPLQRLLQRQISGNSCALSPITELAHNMRDTLLDGGGTPKSSTLRSFNSVSSSYDSSNSLDDEYMAMFELETLEELPLDKLPGDLDALISGQLKVDANEPPLRSRSARRCLSMTQQDQLSITPLKHAANEAPSVEQQARPSVSHHMRKVMSMNDADILNALADEPELIGDLSRPCALPVLLTGVRHRDLKTISCETLARLMRGEFAELKDQYQIIDCRYPYEFEGGHIRGALNLYTQALIKDAFPPTTGSADRRLYIFHCEFSSERGPKLLRFLRSNDRSLHTHNYPSLDYPELYLLHNGYKEFYGSYVDLCDPRNYVPMLAPAHNEAYRMFRAKTKSWQGGDSDGGDSGIGGAEVGGGGVGSSARPRILRKSRSRLLYAE